MRVQIKKQGNSASVRIPSSLLSATLLRLGQIVEIRHQGACIVIQAIETPRVDLHRLVEAMEPSTFPDAFDFGSPMGLESC